jgi:GAF domain-containing protein
MNPDRLAEILAELSAGPEAGWSSARLCELSREVVGVDGAGVMLMSGELPVGTLCTTDEVSDRIEQLQYTFGEGPCVEAYRDRRVVLEPDLAAPAVNRWPAFTTAALAAGAGAVFGFPLLMGAARLGALNLYRKAPGTLRDDQHLDALAMAQVIAGWVLQVQSTAPAGQVAKVLAQDLDLHAVVHNAAGAVSVQLGVGITEALLRLRAYAFANDRPLDEVAEDIVARRLRLG